MQTPTSELPPPLPGVIPALTAGFNAVAAQVGVILLPIGFDIFLWLGPRVTITRLMAPVLKDMQTLSTDAGQAIVDPQILADFWQNFNLFNLARTFPLGVFSLMSNNLASQSPLGMRTSWEASSPLIAIGIWLALTLLGWLLGSLYFASVAHVAVPGNAPVTFSRAALHGMLFSSLWAAMALIVGIPFIFFLGVLTLINPTVTLLVILFFLFIAASLFPPIYFSSYGIFSDGQNVLRSLWSGVRLTRYGMPAITLFTLVTLVISQGLDFLWRIPPANSGLTLVGIFGHAFISTGLLAASFIYYHEMNAWIESATRWFNNKRVVTN
ncbi:hypothetical protein GW781_05660 [bacterium]|nr:hypothetical protein [bacterium]NCT20622.1 hypothetical protein [bacterium]